MGLFGLFFACLFVFANKTFLKLYLISGMIEVDRDGGDSVMQYVLCWSPPGVKTFAMQILAIRNISQISQQFLSLFWVGHNS